MVWNLPQPCVFIANHQHNLDLILSASLVPFKTFGIGKKSIKWLPIFGTAYWLAGNILIDRKNRASALASMREVEKSVQRKGISVWIMPEGTRSKGRGLLPFQKKGPFIWPSMGTFPLFRSLSASMKTFFDGINGKQELFFIKVGEPISTKGMNASSDSNALREKSRETSLLGIHEVHRIAKEHLGTKES